MINSIIVKECSKHLLCLKEKLMCGKIAVSKRKRKTTTRRSKSLYFYDKF